MPILEIEIVQERDEDLDARLAGDLADTAAAVFGSSPGRTWVRLRALPRTRYTENGGGPSDEVLPVFVSVLHAKRPEGNALAKEIADLTQAIAGVCRRSAENVHLFYQPDGNGRVAFGGVVVGSD